MNTINITMYDNLMRAIHAYQRITPEKLQSAQAIIHEIITVKNQMEALAVQRGYSQACKEAIPTCQGECCKYHYPKHLTPADFFIAIHHIAEDKLYQLSELLSHHQHSHCPVLMKNGCFFTFEQRPVTCTNAYPCFSDRAYWEKKELKSVLLKQYFNALNTIVPFDGP